MLSPLSFLLDSSAVFEIISSLFSLSLNLLCSVSLGPLILHDLAIFFVGLGVPFANIDVDLEINTHSPKKWPNINQQNNITHTHAQKLTETLVTSYLDLTEASGAFFLEIWRSSCAKRSWSLHWAKRRGKDRKLILKVENCFIQVHSTDSSTD